MNLSQYVFEPLRTDEEFVLYRAEHSTERGLPSVLVLVPAAEHPRLVTLKKLEHEYGLRHELDSAWALRPLTLSEQGGQTMLTLEDPGGDTLEKFISAPMETVQFLRVAIGLATALGGLHARRLIHKDVKPANALINPATGEVRLMGFGIASRQPRERQTPQPPETIAGTLAYMAPEQTGRMNRSIDCRSDLYALGVTLYRMLTGSLPFTAAEPIEWVHCHIARAPIAPGERVANVPTPVSAIIMKLLAKTGEQRYQTAAGLERDLRRCLSQFEAEERIDDFALGEQDTPDRLLIPEKLYGRAREIEILLNAFDRIVNGGPAELVLVSGYSGIGKSSVVNELHKVLVPPRGLFAAGKFDQYQQDIPYSTLAQAFQGLVRPLLGKGEGELARWRDALCEALGPNGRLMVDLVPELKIVIGDQPPVPELPPPDAQRRFQLVFRRFLSVFARPEHPLALFLDDLQWLDAATLDLLEDLLTQPDLRHLLLVGAYRDNEVSSAHPLTRTLEAIRNEGPLIQEIVLTPLTGADVSRLIADSLHCDRERSMPLAQLVIEKTNGNPFFVIQFLSALAEEGWVTFDHGAGRWSWDLAQIHATGYTDNVVDLLVGTLSRLPIATQEVLQLFACLGGMAERDLLAMVREDSQEAVARDLQDALRSGVVLQSEGTYRFLHDRIQEAAYSLIPEARRAETHLRIGRLLVRHTAPEKRDESIFEIVNQFNRGASLITSPDERQQLAEFNLIAAQRAKAAAACASALTYLAAGAALLPENSWGHLHDLTFALEVNRAECEYVTGLLGAAEERLRTLATHAGTRFERAAVACLRVDVYLTLSQVHSAIAVGLDGLRDMGVDWSPHPGDDEARREYERIWSQLGQTAIEDLAELPVSRDPSTLATLNILTKLVVPALAADSNLHVLVSCRAVNLSLERGNCEASCYAYVWLGAIAGARFGDYQTGYRFGRIGYELVERHGWKRFQPGTYFMFGSVVIPWARPVKAGRDVLHRSIEGAKNIGDVVSAVGALSHVNTNMLAAGDHLAEVERVAEQGLEFARKAQFQMSIEAIAAQLSFVRTLRGLTWRFGCFDSPQFDEPEAERRLASNPNLRHAECFYWIRKLQARFLAGDYAAAVECSSRAQRLLWTLASVLVFEAAEYHLYSALSRAACCDSVSPDERRQHLETLALHQRQLDIWSQNCPENFENRARLVAAEGARLEGRDLDAMRQYEEAIHSARTNGFVQNDALASELAARFYASRGFETIARAYLRNAQYGYLQWGADGKVRQLEEQFPYLTHDDPSPDLARTVLTSVEHLDLSTVLNLSQAVRGETDLDTLIAAVMRLAVEHAGAERGVLILPHGDGHRIEAEARSGHDGVTVDLRQTSIATDDLPQSILQYVLRTRERVVLQDAAATSAFVDDRYLHRRRARSVLCVPLLKQTRLVGIIYLENNLTSGAFTPARMAVLEVLASDAAISLENARLYRDLQEREARVRRLIDANIIGVFTWHADGRVFDANDEFLRILGYSREEFFSSGMRWTDFTLQQWRGRDLRLLEELRQGGTPKTMERELLKKDGARVPVLAGGSMFGGTDQGVAFVIDLTERKRAEQALRESEREARLIVETIPGMVASLTPAGEVEFVNKELVEYCGQELDDMRQWGTNGTVHADDLPHVVDLFGRGITSGEPYDFDMRVRRFDGVYRWFQVRGFPLRDMAGQVVRWYSLLSDIDDRKRAEEALRTSERQFRLLVETIPALVWRGTAEGELDFLNERAVEYLGLAVDSLTGERWLQLVHPDHRDSTVRRWLLSITTGSSYDDVYRLRRADGEYRWIQSVGEPFRDTEGRITHWYGLVIDIEDRKRAETELRALKDQLYKENLVLRDEVDRTSMFEEIVGTSPTLQPVLARVAKVARTDSTVLITGETGTGKELVARAIHRRSPRAARAFVSVNCAAVPRELIASELFGHEKGAFTGATQRRLGRFELAHGGTIFLDEVGELPTETQIALLRVLQEREFARVGGTASVRVDVRVIAATNRDLQAAIDAGTFRSDLFYRLNVFPIAVPALRERADDIPLLVEYFIDRYARKAGKMIRRVNKRTLDHLRAYPWPGNVRELQNVIERSVIVCDTDEFTVDESWLSARTTNAPLVALSGSLAAHEKTMIEEALRASGGRVFGPSGAAARLGIPRSTLESKIRALKINKNRFRVRSAKN